MSVCNFKELNNLSKFLHRVEQMRSCTT